MTKRIFDLEKSEVLEMSRHEIVNCIRQSEGRTLMVENVIHHEPMFDYVSGPELAAAFGADLITLNCLDVFNPKIEILGSDSNGEFQPLSIAEIKERTGRFIGCNLEPVPADFTNIKKGRTCTPETVQAAVELGLDYIMITGNPGMLVTQESILDAIRMARKIAPNLLIIAGKMHGAGMLNDYRLEFVKDFAEAGADIMMFPAPYTTPSVNTILASKMMEEVHKQNMLGLFAIGTSQESSSESYIEKVTMESKAAGCDIMHIGDAGYSGLAPVENIMAMGITLRGRRHHYKRMANRR